MDFYHNNESKTSDEIITGFLNDFKTLTAHSGYILSVCLFSESQANDFSIVSIMLEQIGLQQNICSWIYFTEK